jgi:hypothetical protein
VHRRPAGVPPERRIEWLAVHGNPQFYVTTWNVERQGRPDQVFRWGSESRRFVYLQQVLVAGREIAIFAAA